MPEDPTREGARLQDVGSAIARALVGTLQLADVIAPLAAAIRQVLPLDHVRLTLWSDRDRVRVLAMDVGGVAPVEQFWSATDYPGDVRLKNARATCIRDLASEAGISSSFVQDLVETDHRSALVVPLDANGRCLGALWFAARQTDAFGDADGATIAPIADLLALAAERERLWTIEQERRRKRDKLEALLPTIGDALDVRVVFSRLSAVIQEVIPHVTVALALLTPDRLGVRVHVASNYDVGDLPTYRFTTQGEAISANWRSFVAYDCTVIEEGVVRAQTSRPEDGEPTYIELRPGALWTGLLTR